MEFSEEEFSKILRSTTSRPIANNGSSPPIDESQFAPISISIPNDLIPIGDPISIPATTQPTSEPVLQVKGSERTYLFLHPTQLYNTSKTTEAIELHSLRYAAWIQSQTMTFVRTVAGMQKVPLESLIVTGFEPLHRLIQESLPMESDLPLPHSEYTSYGTQQSQSGRQQQQREAEGGEEEEYMAGKLPIGGQINVDNIDLGSEYSNETIRKLLTLVNTLHGFGSSTDALRAFNYLTRREGRHDAAVLKWLTLPMNLSRTYFQDTLFSAVMQALDKTAQINRIPLSDNLFAEILGSELMTTFAALTSRIMNKNSYNNRSGDKRKHDRLAIDKEIRTLTMQMRFADSNVQRAQTLGFQAV